MRHILQETSSDCGITTFAMLANMSRRAAIKQYPKRQSRVTFREMAAMLEKRYAGEKWATRILRDQTIGTIEWPDGRLAALVRSPEGQTHWLAVYFQSVCDPEIATFSRGHDHPRRHWRVSKMLVPHNHEAIERLASRYKI